MSGDILFLTHRVPFPPDRGDRIRSYHLLKALARHGIVHLGALADGPEDMAAATALDGLVASRHIAPRRRALWQAGLGAIASRAPVSVAAWRSASLAGWVADMVATRPVATIVAFSGQMAQFVPRDFAGRFLMDFVDVDSAKFESYAAAGGRMAPVHAREARLLAAWEAEVAHRADLSLFVSEAEAALFRTRTGLGETRVRALGNGIDTATFDPAAAYPAVMAGGGGGGEDGPLLVFTGQMDYRPNVEAVVGFAEALLPDIRAAVPGTRFAIVGREPVAAVRALARLPGVRVTGAVPDVRGWLAAAEVVVAPLRIARGVQNKLLEAMAMARPVVASRDAAEGIDAAHGRHLMIGDCPADEVRHIVDLLRDPVRRASMGRLARAHVEAHYGWNARLAPLGAMLAGVAVSEAA